MASIVERETAAGARRLFVVFWATSRSDDKRRKIWERVAAGGKKEANARRRDIETGLYRNGGLWPLEASADATEEPETFEAYAARWLEERAPLNVSARVLELYRAAVRLYLTPAFGPCR